MISFFAEGMPDISEESFDLKRVDIDEVKRILQFVLWRLEQQQAWDRDALNDMFVDLADVMDLKIRDLLAPVFVAVSGKPVAPPLFDSLSILGPDMARARVRHALNAIGGVSKKRTKRLEKEYRQL